MYLVGTCDIDDCYTNDYIQVYKKSKKGAEQERQRQIKQAFHGETVLCYDKSGRNGYKDLFPALKVVKKTDARMGEDLRMINIFGFENRKKFLKYQYLGKSMQQPTPINPDYSPSF